MNLARPLFTLVAAIRLVTVPMFAEAPADHPWQARWIGPAAVQSLDLGGASWIWTDEAGIDATRNAKPGSRVFRRDLVLTGNAAVLAATAIFAADNHFRLVVNGKELGRGDEWQHPKVIDLTAALRPGANQLLVHAENDPDEGAINAAGLIGKIRIERAGESAQEIVTDAKWESVEAPGGAAGKPVRVLGGVGIAPWSGIAANASGSQRNLWTCYRKGFSLKELPRSAVARIAVDSKYWLWLNGKLVVREGGVKRGPNPQDTYFDVIDLAPHLKTGDNQIAVLAWYWGKDGFSHKSSGKAGFLFELDAGPTKVLSDPSWRTLRHPAFGEAGNTPNFRMPESSVRFDAMRDIPDWTEPAFDDRAWQFANDFGAPPAAPWNRLWERGIPQWKDFGLKEYENAADLPREGTGAPVSGKLPYNAQVTPWLKVSAPAGLAIKIGMDNKLNEINAEYLTKEGVQEFETPAWMNGHHVVYQIPKGVKILGLKYRESGYDTEFSGHFACDNDFYDKLWVKSQRTLYVTMRDNFMDCPDRERAAWWGDIVVELGEVFYSLSPSSHALIRKCMYDLANWQRPSKTFFSPIPAGNWDKELPQQMLASVGKYGFWNYYLNSGDSKTLADMYPHVKDYLSIWQIDGDGLVVHRAGENGWDWADWGNNVDIRVMDNAWFCLALDGAARMAEVLGMGDDATAFRCQRESIAAAVNRKFWNGSAYRDPGYKGATDDRSNGLAVVAGIAGPDKFPAIKAVLAKERHASPYMEKYVLESLFLMGDPAAGLERMQARYKDIVASPLTTLPELFGSGGTDNHAWSGGPLTLMSQYVAGVAPTSPGFATYQVKPQLGGLNRVSAGFDSVKGRIEVVIVRNDGSFHLKLVSPENTRATVCIPVADAGLKAIRASGKTLWLNGKATGEVPGITAAEAIEGHACFAVAPGTWEFEAR